MIKKTKKITKKKVVTKKAVTKKVVTKKTIKKKSVVKKPKSPPKPKVVKKTTTKKAVKKLIKKRIIKKIPIPKPAKIKKIIVAQEFKAGDNIVYPTHGVGRILTVEKFQYDLVEEQLYVIQFFQDKLTIRVPFSKVKLIGLRDITSNPTMARTLTNLKQKPKIKKAMWSRRAQEYDQKINSGDIRLLSDVVRDLFRKDDQTEQSYSERQMFQVAFERYTREYAISYAIKFEEASEKILEILNNR
jgi:CarD family transcriptional regulator